MLKTISLFLIAGLAEIGGAYLVWQWVRAHKPFWFGLLGIGALLLYALVQTLQPFNFGRAFAAYGGVFISLALLWGWLIDGRTPDKWDWLGVIACLVGVTIILLAPHET
jgi:small multidrug resistance family-3 protein